MLSIAQKVQKARELKDKGNALFKEEKFEKARAIYCQALAYTKGLPGRKDVGGDAMVQMALSQAQDNRDREQETVTEEDAEAIDDLDAVLKTNIATCYLRLSNGSQALRYAREALALRPTAWKTLCRKAEAMVLLKDADGALEATREALVHAPDESARRTIQRVKAQAADQLRQHNEQMRNVYRNVFG